MKFRPQLTMEILFAAAAVLSTALTVALAVILPQAIPFLLAGYLLVFAACAVFAWKLREAVAAWVCGVNRDGAKARTALAGLTAPVALLSGKTLVWYNDAFRVQLLGGMDAPLGNAAKLLPDLELSACRTEEGQRMPCGEKLWQVYGSTVKKRSDSEAVTLLTFTDITLLCATEAEYHASRPGCLLVEVDGYEDVLHDLLDSERARLLEAINRTLEEYLRNTTGLLRRYGNGRFLAMVEERHLQQFAEQRYDILDKIRAIDESRNLSVSIGVGRGGATLHDCQQLAIEALDMAKGRGGDQAAVKTHEGYTFYGGVSHGVEKRSRVRSRQVAKALTDLIREAESVIIMGHRFSDLDAIGAAEGVLRMCKICDVPAAIAVRRSATLAESLIEHIRANGGTDDFVEPEDALPLVNRNTLCVVVDTYRRALVESSDILDRCGTVVVIDHHRKMEGFIENAALVCHEPYASSTCELVAEILQYTGDKNDKPTQPEAEGLLAGIMLDTRSFSLHTGVRTFEAAAYLRRCGAETEITRKLFNTSLEEYKTKCALVEGTQLYRGCAISFSGPLPSEMKVAVPQAANDLLDIEGVQASFVAVQKPGDTIHISARSMGEVNVQVIMEALGGGGHQAMAAAQLRNVTPDEAYKRLCAAIDLYRAAQAQASGARQ